MEVSNNKDSKEYKVAYTIGRVVGLTIVIALGLLTLLLIGGLGYKLLAWLCGF